MAVGLPQPRAERLRGRQGHGDAVFSGGHLGRDGSRTGPSAEDAQGAAAGRRAPQFGGDIDDEALVSAVGEHGRGMAARVEGVRDELRDGGRAVGHGEHVDRLPDPEAERRAPGERVARRHAWRPVDVIRAGPAPLAVDPEFLKAGSGHTIGLRAPTSIRWGYL